MTGDLRASRLARRVYDLYGRRDWEVLATLMHPGGLYEAVSAPGQALDRSGLLDAVQALDREDRFFRADLQLVDDVDADAAVVEATIRWESESGGSQLRNACWLLTFVDGLHYRTRVYETPTAAREAYGVHGVDLGLSHASG